MVLSWILESQAIINFHLPAEYVYRFSYKVNQRWRVRQLKRQSIRQIIVPDNDSSDNNYSNESDEELLEIQHQQQQPYEETFHMSIGNQYDSFTSSIDHLNDDIK